MLTSLSWVPKGAMKAVPIRSSDSPETVRAKLRRQNPDFSAGREDNHNGDEGDVSARYAEPNSDAEENDRTGPMHLAGGVDSVLEQVESDEEEKDDARIKETDLVFVAASADAEQPRLELYVYDEPEDSLYVHHDAELSAFPLSTAWLTDGAMSLCAVGTMRPFVEIWNLDVVDAVEPSCLLGGCANPSDNYRRNIKPRMLQADSHTDAVIAVRWNTRAQHILATGGADHSVKLWDLHAARCVGTYVEPDRLQSLDWHRDEANLLLSGGFDGVAVLRDCRAPERPALRFAAGGAIERVEFAPATAGRALYASTSDGAWMAFDTRAHAQHMWRAEAHGGDTTFACSPHIAGLLAAGGKDGEVSLWDARDTAQAPRRIVSRSYRTGAVLSLGFHPNSPHILGAAGSRGEPLVYTTTDDIQSVFGS